MTTSVSFLSAAIWIPILTGLFILAFGNDRNGAIVRTVALVGAVLQPALEKPGGGVDDLQVLPDGDVVE